MLAVIETHPIQYHAPVYRLVQQTHGIPVTAIYGSDFSVRGYRDDEFGTTFSWDTDLLSGYTSVFLSQIASGGADTADQVSTRGLAQVLRELKPAAVLTVGYSPRFHRDAWLAAWRTGSTILFRGETNDDARQRSWWKQVGRDAALRAAYRTCARLLYVGRRSRAHFERLGVSPDRLFFSPYCVDVTPFETSEAARTVMRPQTRHQLGLSDDDCLLLFSGKLSWRKGVDLFVQAAKALPSETRARTVLAFLGDGSLQEELRHQAARTPAVRAMFLGFQNQHQLSRYYHAADLLVLPSRESETWGLVVNEALHHGVPCVVSDKVGCGLDLIDQGVTGRICPAGAVPELVAAIQATAALRGREDVRQACRSQVAGYTTDRAAAGIAEAFASAVGAGKAA
jgi:glycosyltransferase involved in cell wall biosynthesis